ncbi:DUF58 domain-containing protein [Halobacteriovorax sp. ZH4_bin.1]|uniref:DUF58 domain-containing protein n=1 Tax=unclassified Halobacteriovorax TaxID=2639665 RepID=UPI00371EB9D5
MKTLEVHQIVQNMKNSLFKRANSFSIGMLKSHFRGTGLKFKEHQVYVHGDDVRFIDWKMVAKTNTPYIKTFEEERNVEITILLDCSPGMVIGHNGKSKLAAAFEIISLLYLLSEKTHDYIETIICLNDRVVRVQKKRGEAGLVAFVDALRKSSVINKAGEIDTEYLVSQKERNFEKFDAELVREFYKKREVVILSDFYEFLSPETLKRLTARKHVHAFRLLCPLDTSNEFRFSVIGRIAGKGSGKVDAKLKGKVEPLNYGFRLKDINVGDRYLEDFVKEML